MTQYKLARSPVVHRFVAALLQNKKYEGGVCVILERIRLIEKLSFVCFLYFCACLFSSF